MKQTTNSAHAQGGGSLSLSCAPVGQSRKLSVSRMIDWLKDQRSAAVSRKRALSSALKDQEREIADYDLKIAEFQGLT